MELVSLNAAARNLVPENWFGRHCWQAFPVVDQSCATRCEAVRAVRESDEITYCHENIRSPDGEPVTLGVAVIPLNDVAVESEQSVLLLRPHPGPAEEKTFQDGLLRDASALLQSLQETCADPVNEGS